MTAKQIEDAEDHYNAFPSYPDDGLGQLVEIFCDNTSTKSFSIYRQDSGMGEHDYAVFLNAVFLFRAEHHKVARNIVMAIQNRLAIGELMI